MFDICAKNMLVYNSHFIQYGYTVTKNKTHLGEHQAMPPMFPSFFNNPNFASLFFRTFRKDVLTKIYRLEFYSSESAKKLPHKVGFIGDGAMAKAICRSIQRQGLIDYSQVYVSSPFPKNLDAWKDLGANVSTDNSVVANQCDIVFLAVKPHLLQGVLRDMVNKPASSEIKDKLFVSILAGIPIKDLEEMLAKFEGSRVVRVMPNTPMLVGKGCTVYCPGTTVTEHDLELVQKILEVTGMCQLLPEHMINAVGAVASSGPAFVYLFIEALSDGGVRMGLHRDMATRFAAQTVMGAAKMVLDTSKHMGTLKDEVCSAGGQTIAGIHALERGGVRGAVMDAVEAAALRAAELGKQSKK